MCNKMYCISDVGKFYDKNRAVQGAKNIRNRSYNLKYALKEAILIEGRLNNT